MAKQAKVKPVKTKKNEVKCIVKTTFFGVKENKLFRKGESFNGTIDRVANINKSIANALEIVSSEVD